MPKQTQKIDNVAAPQRDDAPEVELGKEAIEAGLKVLLESGALYYQTKSHRPLVEDILMASLRSAGYLLRISKDQSPVL